MKPYRTLWTFKSSSPGCYGWNSRSATFATEAEAIDAMNEPFKAGVFEACVHQLHGNRWKLISSRKRIRPVA